MTGANPGHIEQAGAGSGPVAKLREPMVVNGVKAFEIPRPIPVLREPLHGSEVLF